MSTSDPKDPTTAKITPVPDEVAAAPEADAAPAAATPVASTASPAPAAATSVASTSSPAPAAATSTPAAASAPSSAFTARQVAADEEAARHAAVRPTPLPPDPAPSPRYTTGVPAGATTGALTPPPPVSKPVGSVVDGAPSTAAGVAGTPQTRREASLVGAAGAGATSGAAHSADTATTPAAHAAGTSGTGPTTGTDPVLFPDPSAPRTISFGTHVLGVLVGLVLPGLAALVLLIGNSRILEVQADGWVAAIDMLGIVLVTLGVLLLGGVALLCLWTPWVGFVGGTLLTLAGGFALYAPGLTRQAVLDLMDSDAWRPAVVQTVVSATSGVLLAAGVLVLGAGIVSSSARRHGLHLGAFRERHRSA